MYIICNIITTENSKIAKKIFLKQNAKIYTPRKNQLLS